jgi:RimJ/RimL family protein N-acetyltransferase
LKINAELKLKNVTNVDIEFLYQLLCDRNPNANISHKKMPTFEKHEKFVLSKPYTKWYIIIFNQTKIGSIYLSKSDEIGIFLKKDIQNHGLGNLALHLLMKKNPRKRFLANVNPKNTVSSKFFKKNNFKLIQHTYEYLEKLE